VAIVFRVGWVDTVFEDVLRVVFAAAAAGVRVDASLEEDTADELGLAFVLIMAMVVFGFQECSMIFFPRQQKTVQKISVI